MLKEKKKITLKATVMLGLLGIIASGVAYSGEVARNDRSAAQEYRQWSRYSTGTDVPVNSAAALSSLRKSADRGYGPAEVTLGDLYTRGHLVSQDYRKAFYWYERAAEHSTAIVDIATADEALGYFYEHGLGTPRNLVLAHEAYMTAAMAGFP